jgi:hypothetical protein
MPKSRQQLQAESLSYLEKIGISEQEFERGTSGLNALEYYLTISAANFILKVRENLEVQGKVDTGGLSENLQQSAVIKNGNTLSISIGYEKDSKQAKYYDYVNKGVMGYKSKSPFSKYKFDSNRPNPNKDMVFNIAKWLRRNASLGRREDSRTLITTSQRKRRSLSTMVDENKRFKSFAFAVAKSIKQKGIKKSGFFDDAIQYSFGADFANTLSKLVGREIQLTVQAIQPNGNNNQ